MGARFYIHSVPSKRRELFVTALGSFQLLNMAYLNGAFAKLIEAVLLYLYEHAHIDAFLLWLRPPSEVHAGDD